MLVYYVVALTFSRRYKRSDWHFAHVLLTALYVKCMFFSLVMLAMSDNVVDVGSLLQIIFYNRISPNVNTK